MTDKVIRLMQRLRDLEDDLETEFERRRKQFDYRIEQRKIVFGRDVQRQHIEIKQKLSSYFAGARPLVVIIAPVIYSLIFPLMLLDLFLALYQAICFPVYQIEKVKRADYINFDRNQLSYLNGLEKLNCMYCSYGNGLLAFAQEIAGLTEKYWCPIKHSERMAGVHRHYAEFLEYGDAHGYRDKQQQNADSQSGT